MLNIKYQFSALEELYLYNVEDASESYKHTYVAHTLYFMYNTVRRRKDFYHAKRYIVSTYHR